MGCDLSIGAVERSGHEQIMQPVFVVAKSVEVGEGRMPFRVFGAYISSEGMKVVDECGGAQGE